MRNLLASGFVLLVVGCAPQSPPRFAPSEPLVLPGSDGRTHDVMAAVTRAKLTVFVFYSKSCPCLSVHEPRLAALAREYRAQNVTWFIVDSEVDADPESDAREAQRRGYVMPLLTDRGARVARAMNAEFATHAVVVDASGRIRYSGAIDSDKNRLHEAARSYLSDALNAILAGREPRTAEREPLGCALMLY